MKTIGIVAEYNPFHNGHKFHIEETRRQTGADYVVVAMSGDFLQRGAPGILDKYTRTRTALENGADLVIQLPVTASLCSAEGFARSGVSIFHGLGVVDGISFGSEAPKSQNAYYERIASLLSEEPDEYKQLLNQELKKGLSFPKARAEALIHLFPEDTQLGPFLGRSNNVLGLEYEKAIYQIRRAAGDNFQFESCIIERRGSSYESTDLQADFSSASAIRNYLLGNHRNANLDAVVAKNLPSYSNADIFLPEYQNMLLSENDFSQMLYHGLLYERDQLESYGSDNQDLAHRIGNHLEQFENWTQFAQLIKTRNQTYTAISRYLCQLLLHIKRDDLALAASYDYAPYARVLGFRRDASPLLKRIQEQSSIPVLMHLAADEKGLDDHRSRLLQLDIAAAEVYRYVKNTRSGIQEKSEYRQPLIIL